MIAAFYARKSTKQTGVRQEIPPEIREYLVAMSSARKPNTPPLT